MTHPHRTDMMKFAEKIAGFLEECRGIAEPILAGLMSTFLGVWVGSIGDGWHQLGRIWALGVSFVFAAIWYWGHKHWLNPRYSKLVKEKAALKDEISELKNSNAVTIERLEADLHGARMGLQGSLKSLLVKLHENIELSTVNTRISAYGVVAGRFVLLARFSRNPELEKEGRGTYPIRQGVIGRAWENEGARYEPTTSGMDREAWEQNLVESYGFTPEEAAGLSMFSRDLVAIRVDTPSHAKVGMLVFESEQEGTFPVRLPRKVRENTFYSAVAEIIIGWRNYFPHAQKLQNEVAAKDDVPTSQIPKSRGRAGTWKRLQPLSTASEPES